MRARLSVLETTPGWCLLSQYLHRHIPCFPSLPCFCGCQTLHHFVHVWDEYLAASHYSSLGVEDGDRKLPERHMITTSRPGILAVTLQGIYGRDQIQEREMIQVVMLS